MYVTQFQDGSFRPLATFEEDIDVTTGSAHGVGLMGDSLSTWRERQLVLRSRNRANTSSSQVNQAVWIGWNREVRGAEELGRPATFTITLPDTLGAAWSLGGGSSLQLSLLATDDEPGPRAAADEGADEGEGRSAADPADKDGDEEGERKDPIDLRIEGVATKGNSAKVALSDYGPIRRPLETRVLRRTDLEEERFAELFELVFQTFSIPLSDFTRLEPTLDLRTLTEIRLVFDVSGVGTVVLDDVGIASLDDAFMAVRVPSGL